MFVPHAAHAAAIPSFDEGMQKGLPQQSFLVMISFLGEQLR